MKYLVVSDIHGSIYYMKYLIKIIEREKPNKIILLGDLYSHRDNDLECIEILNKYSDMILCTRGNCDTLEDEEKSNFSFEDSIKIMINNKLFFFTHGHKYNIYNIPTSINVYVHGHLHTGFIRKINNILSVNPGSLSFPRNNTLNSYLIIDECAIVLKDVQGDIIDEFEFDWM